MTMSAAILGSCDDVLIGGTISGSTITGGVSVSNVGLSIQNYGGLWGSPGFRNRGAEVIGQPGVTIPGNKLPRPRSMVLLAVARALSAAGVYADTELDDNMSALLGEFTDPDGSLIEWVRADETSVWVTAYQLSPSSVTQSKQRRFITVPLTSPWPYWQDEVLNTDTVNGAGVSLSPAIGGDVKQIGNPTMVFAGDGSFTDDTTGLTVTIAGSASAVTVARDATTGRWTVKQAGVSVPGLASWNDTRVMVLTKGGTFTSTVSVDVSWRDQWA